MIGSVTPQHSEKPRPKAGHNSLSGVTLCLAHRASVLYLPSVQHCSRGARARGQYPRKSGEAVLVADVSELSDLRYSNPSTPNPSQGCGMHSYDSGSWTSRVSRILRMKSSLVKGFSMNP